MVFFFFDIDNLLEKVNILVTQLYPTLCDPMDYSPPCFSVHRILQARILEWLPFPFPGDVLTQGSDQGSNPGLLHCRQILHHPSHQQSLIICLMPCNLLFSLLFSFRRYLETITFNNMLIFIQLSTFPSHSKSITKTCCLDPTIPLIQTKVSSTEFLMQNMLYSMLKMILYSTCCKTLR